MSKIQEIIKNTLNFFQSDEWLIPIMDFTLANCIMFAENNNNTIEQFECFLGFVGLIEYLIEKNVCFPNNITINDFENLIFNEYLVKNNEAFSIISDIYKQLNYDGFRREMIAQNLKIEREVTNLLESTSKNENLAQNRENEPPKSIQQNINMDKIQLKGKFPVKPPSIQQSCLPALSPRFADGGNNNNNAGGVDVHINNPRFGIQRRFDIKASKPSLKASLLHKPGPSLLPPLMKSPRF